MVGDASRLCACSHDHPDGPEVRACTVYSTRRKKQAHQALRCICSHTLLIYILCEYKQARNMYIHKCIHRYNKIKVQIWISISPVPFR